ncbi:hypothetical protein BH11VER1_BH11VER1_21060 [soil metagenome]
MRHLSIPGLFVAVSCFVTAGTGHAATFILSSNSTTAQTLNANGETGTVNSGVSLTLGGSTVAVSMSATTSLTNNGTIQQTGTGRAIDSTAANSSLTISNTGTISAVTTDAIRVNTDSAISLTNSGTIIVSAGGQAIDLRGITTKSNSVTNQAGGVISAVGEDAIRPGVNGVIINAGTITATPVVTAGVATGSDGIDGGLLTGINITNTGTISGRHGITGGDTIYSITINNNAGTISAVNGSGVNIDGVFATAIANVTNAFGATIRGGVLAATTNGDGDGVDVDGVLTLNNSGDILGYGAKGVGSDTLPNNAEAVSAGGGTIINTATGRIIGSSLAADAPNGDTSRAGNGILVDNSSGGNAVAATSVTNSGLIQGKTGVAIKMVSNFDNTITNNAGGTIRGAGTGAAIQSGSGNDTLTNRGSIIGDNGLAIDLGVGNDTLKIEGNLALVTGDVSGGTGTNTATFDLGIGNTFQYGNQLSNFSTIDIKTGTTTLTSSGVITGGATAVKAGAALVDSGTFNGTGTSITIETDGHFYVTGAGSTGLAAFTGTNQSLNLQSGSYVHFDIGGTLRGTGYDYIATVTDFVMPTSGAAVHFMLNYGSFNPTPGDTFDLIDFNNAPSSLSLFDFSAAPSGYAWDTSNFVSNGSISLVAAAPEPSRSLLLLLGIMGLILRRSRSGAPAAWSHVSGS